MKLLTKSPLGLIGAERAKEVSYIFYSIENQGTFKASFLGEEFILLCEEIIKFCYVGENIQIIIIKFLSEIKKIRRNFYEK